MLEAFFSHNPLINRLKNDTSRPSLRFTAWLFFGVSMLFLGLGYWIVLHASFAIVHWVWRILWFFQFSGPMVIAVFSTLSASRDIQRGHYQLLVLTDLADHTLFTGYIVTLLYQLRLLVGFMLALLPLMCTLGFFIVIEEIIKVRASSPLVLTVVPPTRGEVSLPIFGFVLLSLGLLATPIMAVAIGLMLALRYRNEIKAILIAFPLAGGLVWFLTLPLWIAFLIPQISQITITLCVPTFFLGGFSLVMGTINRIGMAAVRVPFDN